MAGRYTAHDVYVGDVRYPEGTPEGNLEAALREGQSKDAKVSLDHIEWTTAGGGDSDGPPPKSGRGSGVGAWSDYAAEQGVTVDDDATRDDIIEALEAAGKRTE